jgi:tripartite-type tricarboxylate transporter receptor subunit TctC
MFKARRPVHRAHPYAGGPAAQLALLSGQVDFTIDNLATASANIKAGKLKALAVTTARAQRPCPTCPPWPRPAPPGPAQLRHPHLVRPLRPGAPAGATRTARLNKAFVDALATPEVKARMAALMAEPAPDHARAVRRLRQGRAGQVRALVKASGAKAD